MDKVAELEEKIEALEAQLYDARNRFANLFGVAAALHDALTSVEEWAYFGNRDTKRCFWCKAWLKLKQGHKPNCKRDRALKAWKDFIFISNTADEIVNMPGEIVNMPDEEKEAQE